MTNANVLAQQAEKQGELIRPSLCENCKKARNLIKHHRDYSKPLEVTWLCYSCHKKEHLANKELRSPYSKPKNNNKTPISAEVTFWTKEAFTKWWKSNNYASEAEAVRALIREKIEELTK